MNILLPWINISGHFYRLKVNHKRGGHFARVMVHYNLNVDRYMVYAYQAYDPINFEQLFDSTRYNKVVSPDEAKQIVDDALIKSGWRILNDGDKLLSLL